MKLGLVFDIAKKVAYPNYPRSLPRQMGRFHQIQVWDAINHKEIYFDSKDIGESHLAWIIENAIIQFAMKATLSHYPQVTSFCPVQLLAIKKQAQHIELISGDKQIFQAKLAIAADGAQSWLRTQSGIANHYLPYHQTALVTNVCTSLPHQQIARQVFLTTGPLAFLPLSSPNTSSIVWSLSHDEAKHIQSMPEALFKDKLAAAFEYRLGNILKTSERYAFPLFHQQAHNYVSSGVALLGDAAHTVHPLAGQGVNLGLRDVESLAMIIAEAIKKQQNFASQVNLRRYERWRKADNLPMLWGIDALKNIFASEKKSIRTLRGMGLTILNQSPLIKNFLTQYAVGNH